MTRSRTELQLEDLVGLIDSREQEPLELLIPSRRATLTTGDYSVEGLQDLVAVERKSLPDLIMCVGSQRERFEREVQRLKAYETRVIVVEASWLQIESGIWRGTVKPSQVIGSLYGWMAEGITIDLAGNRERAARAVSRILFIAARRYWRRLHKFKSTLKLVGGE